MSYLDKIRTREELVEIVRAAQAEGKVVVHCHGCFDILHPGHLRHLTWASAHGDVLVVTVSSDSVVAKGDNRPYIPERLRAETLASIEVVNYVAVDDGTWVGQVESEGCTVNGVIVSSGENYVCIGKDFGRSGSGSRASDNRR